MEKNLTCRSTQEVVDHHIRYLAEGNLEEVLADYDESTLLLNMGGAVTGMEALKDFFINNIRSVFPPDTEQSILIKHICGDMGYIVWKADSRFFHCPFGSDTFVVKNGKISYQSFAGIMEACE